MAQPRRESPNPEGGHHISQLADCRISQNPFDIELGYRNRGREKRGGQPNVGDEE